MLHVFGIALAKNLPKIYQVNYFNPFENIPDKLSPFAFLRFVTPLE